MQRNSTTNVLNLRQDGLPLRSIPISIQEESFTESDETRYEVFLTESEQEVALKAAASSWYIININRYGYFIPSYDPINWEALINFLQNGDLSKISSVDRALLIENAFISAEAGRLYYPSFLELLRYISREVDYFPIQTLIKTSNRLRSHLSDASTQHKFLVTVIPTKTELIYQFLTDLH